MFARIEQTEVDQTISVLQLYLLIYFNYSFGIKNIFYATYRHKIFDVETPVSTDKMLAPILARVTGLLTIIITAVKLLLTFLIIERIIY